MRESVYNKTNRFDGSPRPSASQTSRQVGDRYIVEQLPPFSQPASRPARVATPWRVTVRRNDLGQPVARVSKGQIVDMQNPLFPLELLDSNGDDLDFSEDHAITVDNTLVFMRRILTNDSFPFSSRIYAHEIDLVQFTNATDLNELVSLTEDRIPIALIRGDVSDLESTYQVEQLATNNWQLVDTLVNGLLVKYPSIL